MVKNFYAVRVGRQSNVIVLTWAECEALVTGYSKARFKGFKYQHEAEKWLKQKPEKPSHFKKVKEVQWELDGDWKTPKKTQKCLERKSYFCPIKHQYFKNRCIRRYWATMVGSDYIPSDDDSVPWEIENE